MNTWLGLLIAVIVLSDVIFLVIFAYMLGWRKERPPDQRKGSIGNEKVGYIVLLLFLGVWTFVTLLLNAKMVHGAIRQRQAVQFPSVEGKVIHCKVEERSDGDGTSYDVDMLYSYKVQGQEHTCNRVRFLKLWDKSWVVPFVEAHPAGSAVAVYYNRDDPSDAVLLPGLAGQELVAPFFTLPFNIVMVGLWWFFVSRLFFGQAAYFRILEEGSFVRVRLTSFQLLPASFLCLTFGSVLLCLLLLCCAGMPPSIEAGVAAWAIYLGGCAFLISFFARYASLEKRDLVIDRLRNVLTFASPSGHTEPIIVPLDALRAVDVVQEQRNDADGPSYVYIPVLRWHSDNGDVQDTKIALWKDEEEAQRLAEWLRTAVGRPRSPEQ